MNVTKFSDAINHVTFESNANILKTNCVSIFVIDLRNDRSCLYVCHLVSLYDWMVESGCGHFSHFGVTISCCVIWSMIVCPLYIFFVLPGNPV